MNFINEIKYLLHRIVLRKNRKTLLIENNNLQEENNNLKSRIHLLEDCNREPLMLQYYVSEIRVAEADLINISEETGRTKIEKYLVSGIGKAISADLLQRGNIQITKINDFECSINHTTKYRAEAKIWFEENRS